MQPARWRSAGNRAAVLRTVILRVATLALLSQVVQAADYRFYRSEGKGTVPVPEGTVWLYHYNWGGFQRFKLSDIRQGQAKLELDARKLREEVKPARNTDAFLIVLEFPQMSWYRTKDLKPKTLLQQWRPALETLGKVRPPEDEPVRTIVLPALEGTKFRLVSPEGKPLARRSIPVSIFVTSQNHCGVHQGLPLGMFATDDDGWLEVRAPDASLYLDLRHWTLAGEGFAGQMYAGDEGLRVEPGTKQIQLKTSLPGEQWELRLCDRMGDPVPNILFLEWMKISRCGASSGALGRTDAEGAVRVWVEPSAVAHLAFKDAHGEQRRLSEDELTTLFREKALTVEWSRYPLSP